jgi:hypothetical protein
MTRTHATATHALLRAMPATLMLLAAPTAAMADDLYVRAAIGHDSTQRKLGSENIAVSSGYVL